MRRLTHTDEKFNVLSLSRFRKQILCPSPPYFSFFLFYPTRSRCLSFFLCFPLLCRSLHSLSFFLYRSLILSLLVSPLSFFICTLHNFLFLSSSDTFPNSLSYSLLSLSKYLVLSFISVSSAFGPFVLSASLSSFLFLTVEYIGDNQEFLFTL